MSHIEKIQFCEIEKKVQIFESFKNKFNSLSHTPKKKGFNSLSRVKKVQVFESWKTKGRNNSLSQLEQKKFNSLREIQEGFNSFNSLSVFFFLKKINS